MSPRPSLVFAVLMIALPACKGAEPEQDSTKKAAVEPAKGADEGAAEAGPDTAAAPQGEAGETGETETETGEEPLEPLPESFDEVGVDSCDQYVDAYATCIEAKVPEAERDALRRSVHDNIKAWKQMAESGPSAEKGLQTACRIALEQAKRATEAWGCEW